MAGDDKNVTVTLKADGTAVSKNQVDEERCEAHYDAEAAMTIPKGLVGSVLDRLPEQTAQSQGAGGGGTNTNSDK